jgi:hypothetical protein
VTLPGGIAVYYYFDYKGEKFGSMSSYKTWMMSKLFADGRYYVCGIAEFDGYLMGKEWKG